MRTPEVFNGVLSLIGFEIAGIDPGRSSLLVLTIIIGENRPVGL
jgi:hypothetical protein